MSKPDRLYVKVPYLKTEHKLATRANREGRKEGGRQLLAVRLVLCTPGSKTNIEPVDRVNYQSGSVRL